MDSTVAETSIDLDALTEDEFLGGQLRLLQPRHGYRAGMDAVLLAASVPAEAGQAVLARGCGAGTAGATPSSSSASPSRPSPPTTARPRCSQRWASTRGAAPTPSTRWAGPTPPGRPSAGRWTSTPRSDGCGAGARAEFSLPLLSWLGGPGPPAASQGATESVQVQQMLETLSKGFRNARLKLQGKAELSEDNIKTALRDVRVSLLEADVELSVVKEFLRRVQERAVGEVVQLKAKEQPAGLPPGVKLTPADYFVKICHDELVGLMGPVDGSLALDASPAIIMMVGLQGKEPHLASAESTSYGVRIVEPVLRAMEIPHRAVEGPDDVPAIVEEIDGAYRASHPFIHLIGRSPEAP